VLYCGHFITEVKIWLLSISLILNWLKGSIYEKERTGRSFGESQAMACR
jgi:hypothetical protein